LKKNSNSQRKSGQKAKLTKARGPTHAGLDGGLPDFDGPGSPISFASYGWQKGSVAKIRPWLWYGRKSMPITPTNPFKGRQYPGEVILLAVRWYLSSWPCGPPKPMKTRSTKC
jgi:hypothetical protein